MARQKESIAQRLSNVTINIDSLKHLYKEGWTDAQVSSFLNITRDTIEKWKKADKQFFIHLKGWKDLADSKVEKCLYKRAIGYKYNEVTYEKSNVGGLALMLDKEEIEGITHTDTAKTKIVVKAVIPDVTAQIFWLKNRQPEQWRDKHEEKQADDRLEDTFDFVGVPTNGGDSRFKRFLN